MSFKDRTRMHQLSTNSYRLKFHRHTHVTHLNVNNNQILGYVIVCTELLFYEQCNLLHLRYSLGS